MNIISKIKEKLMPQNKEAMSFKAAMDLCSLPVVTFYQGDKKYNFLLDTGSNNSIIDKSVLKDIISTSSNMTSSLFGMEGRTTEVDVCNITLYFNDKAYPYYYLIQDMSTPFGLIKQESGVTLHGIVGSNFFNEFKYVLDFAELVAYSKK